MPIMGSEVSAAALEQSGYDGESKDFNCSKCGVIFANALGGETATYQTLEYGLITQRMSH